MPHSTMGKSLAWGLALIGALILMLGGYCYIRFLKFHNRVAQLREEGVVITREEISHKVADPEDDVVSYLVPLKDDLKAYNRVLAEAGLLDADRNIGQVDLDQFAELERTYPRLAAKLEQASHIRERDTGIYEDRDRFSILDWSTIKQVQTWRAKVYLRQGEVNKPARLARQLIRYSETVGESSLLSGLLANAFRIRSCEIMYEAVSAGGVERAVARDFAAAVAQIDTRERFARAVETERVFCIAGMLNPELHDSDLLQDDVEVSEWAASFPGVAAGVYGNQLLDDLGRAIQIAEEPFSKPVPEIESPKLSLPGSFPGAYSGMVSRIKERIGAAQSVINAVQVVIALDHEGMGDGPADQAVDLDRLRSNAVKDPFTDQRLQVRFDEGQQRWSVYSVGPNGIDDGGPGSGDDHGLGPAKTD